MASFIFTRKFRLQNPKSRKMILQSISLDKVQRTELDCQCLWTCETLSDERFSAVAWNLLRETFQHHVSDKALHISSSFFLITSKSFCCLPVMPLTYILFTQFTNSYKYSAIREHIQIVTRLSSTEDDLSSVELKHALQT